MNSIEQVSCKVACNGNVEKEEEAEAERIRLYLSELVLRVVNLRILFDGEVKEEEKSIIC